jgi:hypothetical protein
MQKRKMPARVAPAAAHQGAPKRWGWIRAALVAAVVEMVRVAVPAVTPVMFTGVVEPKLSVGRYCAPVGLVARTAVSATLPVKPPEGVIVISEVFPVVAPGATETAAPEIAKLGAARGVALASFEGAPGPVEFVPATV